MLLQVQAVEEPAELASGDREAVLVGVRDIATLGECHSLKYCYFPDRLPPPEGCWEVTLKGL